MKFTLTLQGHQDAKKVVVTGNFDNWSQSVKATKSADGWNAKVSVKDVEKLVFKFVVDDSWLTSEDYSVEDDGNNNVNNVLETKKPKDKKEAAPKEKDAKKTKSKLLDISKVMNDAKEKVDTSVSNEKSKLAETTEKAKSVENASTSLAKKASEVATETTKETTEKALDQTQKSSATLLEDVKQEAAKVSPKKASPVKKRFTLTFTKKQREAALKAAEEESKKAEEVATNAQEEAKQAAGESVAKATNELGRKKSFWQKIGLSKSE